MVAMNLNPVQKRMNVLRTESVNAPEVIDFSADEAALREREQALETERQLLESRRLQVETERRATLSRDRNRLLKVAKEYRKQANEAHEREDADARLQWAEEAENEAATLAAQLGIKEETQPGNVPAKRFGLTTTRAILFVIALFLVSCGITVWLGQDALADPMNPMGQSIMKNAPIRAMVSFSMTFLTFLVGIFFLWLFFNPLYRLWHNKINSERTLESILNEAPAWAVLLSLFAFFWMGMELFARFFQAMYA